jgi:hypothetical protein
MPGLDADAVAGQAIAMSALPETTADGFAWSNCLRRCAGAGLALALTALLFNVLVDPYGINPLRIPFKRPLMDLNQRFMYPQILRSGEFDSAVFGSSTSRLLKPADLEAGFGGHFANFGMNAATPFEQSEAVRLYLSHTPRLRTLIWGVDAGWCNEDAADPDKLVTERAFPPWLYGGSALASIPHLFNLRTLEISSRVVLNRLGLMEERLPRDGYEVFTPPETAYDPTRARQYIEAQHIFIAARWPIRAAAGTQAGSPEERASWRYPALDFLKAALSPFPESAHLVILFPPVNMAIEPEAGSVQEAYANECKRRVAAIAQAHRGIAVDFAFASPITREDANYWDALHYRLPIATHVAQALRQARDGTVAAEDFRVIAAE